MGWKDELRTRVRAQDLQPGDIVDCYGVVEWIEVPPYGPNVEVDFVGLDHGTFMARSMYLSVNKPE